MAVLYLNYTKIYKNIGYRLLKNTKEYPKFRRMSKNIQKCIFKVECKEYVKPFEQSCNKLA